MKIINLEGNLLDTTANVIIHQVNCFTIGAGVAKAIIDRWPSVKVAHEHAIEKTDINNRKDLLGKIQPVYVSENQCVINMFSQYNYGNASYDALYDCLVKVRNFVIEHYGHTATIALPYNMSCCRGGASWSVVMAMINDIFESTNLHIEIWKLGEN